MLLKCRSYAFAIFLHPNEEKATPIYAPFTVIFSFNE